MLYFLFSSLFAFCSDEVVTRYCSNVSPSVNMAQQRVCCQDKTPIQILHEYGIKIGSAPEYELIHADGDAHEPSFMFNVTIGDVSCKGQTFVCHLFA